MDTLNQAEAHALHEALDDEYFAWATYDQVTRDFGEVRPFSNIREAEARHIEALLRLYVRYGLSVPENTWPDRVKRFASLHSACEAAVTVEIANAELYERLLVATERPDILSVLRNLQEASQQRHLPAFQRCAQRGGGDNFGQGARHRQGHRDRS